MLGRQQGLPQDGLGSRLDERPRGHVPVLLGPSPQWHRAFLSCEGADGHRLLVPRMSPVRKLGGRRLPLQEKDWQVESVFAEPPLPCWPLPVCTLSVCSRRGKRVPVSSRHSSGDARRAWGKQCSIFHKTYSRATKVIHIWWDLFGRKKYRMF